MAETERWFLLGDRVRCIRADDPLRGLEGTVTDTAPLIVEYDEAGTRTEDPRDVELLRAAREGGVRVGAEARAPPGGTARGREDRERREKGPRR